MLRIVALLLAVTYCSRAEPVPWGSRIVGTPAGKSPTMYLRLPKEALIVVLRNGSQSSMEIKNGKCYRNGQVWGSPCQMDEESANITLNDVSQQEALLIWDGSSFTSTVFFVPNCTFQTPQPGTVNLQTSFPLSRFGKGRSYVEVAFAAQGANEQTGASIEVNGRVACRWTGTTLVTHDSSFCRNMTNDTGSDLRAFVLNITRNDTLDYTQIEWSALTTALVVNIDWTQEGESPEIAECSRYRGETTTTSPEPGVTPTSTKPGVTPTTTKPGVTPTSTKPGVTPTSTKPGVTPTTTSTTASGHEAASTFTTVIALLSMLMLWRRLIG
ncbi:diagnostic antigen gp50 [Echinococcus multilocularis]|uniref:Diagnostic antigen gp50 n=1 Tax=Echinococcus multilocularis TaxID=6211 RepID=A0A068YJJ5_ECHMU|nr:diagnostic antigen gp50 [Echinococcus multilocularis]